MTDEERDEAERVCTELATYYTNDGRMGPMSEEFPVVDSSVLEKTMSAYAAACEAKRAEIDRMDDQNVTECSNLLELVKAERALSAKLHATLFSIRGYLIAIRSKDTEEPIDIEALLEACDRATTEYVAARV